MNRRRLLQGVTGAGTLAAVGDLSFLSSLAPVAAEEAKLPSGLVSLRPEVEPVVRLIEETPRAQLLEKVAGRIREGTGYQQILAGLMLAGVRGFWSHPEGF